MSLRSKRARTQRFLLFLRARQATERGPLRSIRSGSEVFRPTVRSLGNNQSACRRAIVKNPRSRMSASDRNYPGYGRRLRKSPASDQRHPPHCDKPCARNRKRRVFVAADQFLEIRQGTRPGLAGKFPRPLRFQRSASSSGFSDFTFSPLSDFSTFSNFFSLVPFVSRFVLFQSWSRLEQVHGVSLGEFSN